MKRFYKELVLLSLFFFCLFPSLVRADMCSEEEIARLKVLANNISVHYEYLDADDESLDWGNTIPYGYNYAITVSGMSEGISVVSNDSDGYEFDYSDTNDGNVSFYIQDEEGKLTLKFFPSDCSSNLALRTIDISLPVFNDRYYSTECSFIREKNIDLDICKKMIDRNLEISDNDFYSTINKYLDADKGKGSLTLTILSYLSNPYVIVIGIVILIILVALITLGIIRFVKRRKLE